jgi:conjugal transfer ATP-binding protein TraC
VNFKNFNIAKAVKALTSYVRPEAPGSTPHTVASAVALTERNSFTELFSYRFFDAKSNLCYLDDGEAPAVGFVLAINPLMVAGVDAEPNIEAIFLAVPPGSVVQFGKLVTPQVESFIDRWAEARLRTNTNPLLRQIAERRRDFMVETASGPSMLPQTRLHPRMMRWYVSVRIPFAGDVSNEKELATFNRQVLDVRGTCMGALKSAMMESAEVDEEGLKFLLREMLNPHLDPQQRLSEQVEGVPMSKDIVSRNTRVTVQGDGRLGFAGQTGDAEVVVSALTVDAAPSSLYLPMMAQTLGNPVAWDERITCPYWAYTTVHVLHPDDSKDSLLQKFGMLNKQTMSESAWFKSMMGHLYERKDRASGLLREVGSKGHSLVRAYTGINLYTPPDDARAQTEYVKGLFRRAGFRISEEAYIGLPAFLSSMPLQYTPSMDPPNKGLQRAWLMSTLNAASMIQVQGDWRGTGEDRGGLLLVSRSGQVATFDLLVSTTNYNFVVVAASGSGKSFLTNEIVCDFLSKGGIARIVDVGRSYARFCEVMGGENLVFSPDNPMSLNPFTGILNEDDLSEMMPMLKDLLRLMAYPLTPEKDTPSFQYQLLEKAVGEAWKKYREKCELEQVVDWLEEQTDSRANDLALQLEPFARGRYRRWFSGPRTVKFSKSLVVIELEELKQDSALQAVVLQLMMFQTTKEMYLSDRKIPKLLAIDEAWDLMGGLSTGRFIETAFRRMRKYNGIAGVITQSFEDFEKSDAARAAIENAAWQFILYQRPESVEFAVSNKRISADETSVALIKSVRSGNGFSEVFVRGEQGSGLYRFVTDKHSYYTFTTKPHDINRLNDLVANGSTLEKAIDTLAMQDYEKQWG